MSTASPARPLGIQRLVLAGWRVVRITWRQLKRRPHDTRALLKGLWNR